MLTTQMKANTVRHSCPALKTRLSLICLPVSKQSTPTTDAQKYDEPGGYKWVFRPFTIPGALISDTAPPAPKQVSPTPDPCPRGQSRVPRPLVQPSIVNPTQDPSYTAVHWSGVGLPATHTSNVKASSHQGELSRQVKPKDSSLFVHESYHHPHKFTPNMQMTMIDNRYGYHQDQGVGRDEILLFSRSDCYELMR